MNDDRQIFRFAPDIYNQNETMLQVYERQHGEINQYEQLIIQSFLNNFVKKCNLEGVRRFEKVFGIQANEEEDTMELRKARIINKFAFHLPYTRIFVEQMLETIFGEGNSIFYVVYNDYKAKVDIETEIQGLVEETLKDLRQIIPANIIIEVILYEKYMHRYLKKYYTHNDLKQFTYGELSQYA